MPRVGATHLLALLAALGGACAVPPLLLAGTLAIAQRMIGYHWYAILSAVLTFGGNWNIFLALVLFVTIVVFAELGAFWGFVSGTLAIRFQQQVAAAQTEQQEDRLI